MPEPWWRCPQHCLAKNPSARFVSATELLQALQAGAASWLVAKSLNLSQPPRPIPSRAVRHSSPPARPGRWSIDRRLLRWPLVRPRGLDRAPQSAAARGGPTVGCCPPSAGCCLRPLACCCSSGAARSTRRPSSGRWPVDQPQRLPTPTPSPRLRSTRPTRCCGIIALSAIVSCPGPPSPTALGAWTPAAGRTAVCFATTEGLAGQPATPFRQRSVSAAVRPGPESASAGELSGLPLEQIRQVTLAFYDTPAPGDLPWLAIRVDLQSPRSTAALLETWGTTRELVRQERLWLDAAADMAYFLDAAASDPDALHDAFSFGSTQVMRDLEDSLGAAGPLTPQMRSSGNVPTVPTKYACWVRRVSL